MRWLFALIVFVSPAMAEEVTTANVTPDMSAFTASGSTEIGSGCSAGQFCTGNASNGGGTYTSTFDIPLTEAEIQRGFTVTQFVDVTSHPSNATRATCSSITQARDCRDIFSMTVALFDITNTVVEKFEREVELDFGGTQTFTFADEVSPNNFTLLTGEFELFGIDAGFHTGAFGPQFAAPGVTFTHQDVVEQQVLEQIAQLDTQIAFTPPPTEIAAAPPPPPAAPQPVQTVAAYAEPAAPAPPPVVAQIQTPQPEPQEQQQEAQVEAAIEMEMQTQPEPQAEQQQEQQPEPEPQEQAEPEPEQQAEAEPEPEQQAEPQEVVEAEPEPEPEPEQQQAEAEPEPQTKQEKQKAAAERVVKKIAPSQRYSAASQATTMVVMNMLAGKIATDVTMVDTQGFFPVTGMNDDRSMSNPLQDYTMFGGSNAAHDRFMQLEWSR
jgi:chemotaxis protein histidine kinase CheA